MRLRGSVALAALFGVGLLGVAGFTLWTRTHASPPIERLPQDPLIQAYFNQAEDVSYTEPYRHKTRKGDNLEQIIVDTIRSAQVSIDLAVQELNLPLVALALQERHRAGVTVRVVLEHQYNRQMSQVTPQDLALMDDHDRKKYQDFLALADGDRNGQISPTEATQFDALRILQTAGIPVIDDRSDGSRGSDLMHHKFLAVDGKTVLTGSVNYSMSDVHGDVLSPDTLGNANHLVKISHPSVARIFAEEFALLWGDGPGGQPDSQFGLQKPYRVPLQVTVAPGSTVTIQFSPTSERHDWRYSVNGLIGRSLTAATRGIDLALFVFSDQQLANTLEAESRQGIPIRALIERKFLFRDYSEGLDMMGIAIPNARCRYEDANKPWTVAIATVGTPALPDGDVLHHKFAVIDQRWVITGSQNWSAAANHANDENAIIIDNPTVATHFAQEFERLYATAELGVPTNIQTKMQQEQNRCRL